MLREHVGNLASRGGRQQKKSAKRSCMLPRLGPGSDIERRDEVTPAEELPAAAGPVLDLDRQIDQPQDPFVRALRMRPIVVARPSRRPIQLIADHQDLLIKTEARPALGRKRCVLAHESGSPSPIKANVISRTRSRIAGSMISIPRFPWEGRMLMSDVYSMQLSRPRPG